MNGRPFDRQCAFVLGGKFSASVFFFLSHTTELTRTMENKACFIETCDQTYLMQERTINRTLSNHAK
jgi:hypothetical protein